MTIVGYVSRVARAAAALAVVACSFAADAQSAFTHQIPIKVPKGANGMEPNVSLSYVPGAPNGTVGVGWQLTGLSSITRVRYGEGIRYSSEPNEPDTYAHSGLGVLVQIVKPGDPEDGTYRTKKESFTRLEKSGACGNGPCMWVATDRAGTRYTYGSTPNSRVTVGSTSTVRRWELDKVEDVFGNSFRVEYQNDVADGVAYPLHITYTKHATLQYCNDASTSRCRTIDFDWEDRSDFVESYPQNAFEQTKRRLKWIKVQSAGALVREYRLDYECGSPSTPCVATQTGNSRLIAVTEFGSSGVPSGTPVLPPQRFTWADGGSGYPNTRSVPVASWVNSNFGYAVSSLDGREYVDLNADGLVDVVQAYNGFYKDGFAWMQVPSIKGAWLNSVSGFTAKPAFELPVLLAYQMSGSSTTRVDTGVRFADLNGDGRPDIIQGWSNDGSVVRKAWLNNGGNCSTVGCAWTPADQYAPPTYDDYTYFAGRDTTSIGWDGGLRLADLNGDGKLDLIHGFNGLRGAWLNPGATSCSTPGCAWIWSEDFRSPVDFAARDASAPGGWDTGVRLADVDGDGRVDVLKGMDDKGVVTLQAWKNVNCPPSWPECSWMPAPELSPPAAFAGRSATVPKGWDNGIRVVDVNADGLADLLKGISDYSVVTRTAWLATGTGWVPSGAYAPPDVFVVRNASYPQGADNGVAIADLNGDQRPDMLFASTVSGANARTGWINRAGWVKDAGYAPGTWFTSPNNGNEVIDVNGDGRADVLIGGSSGIDTRTYTQASYMSPPNQPDLLASVDNGLGGTTAVAYEVAPRHAGAILPASTQPCTTDPRPQPLAVRVTVTDGRGGSYATTYAYGDGRWCDGPVPEQRFLGFRTLTVKDQQAGQYTTTTFEQRPGYEGAEAEVAAYASGGALVSKVVNEYQLVFPNAGTELLQEVGRRAQAFELGTFASEQYTTTSYDVYGNVKTKVQTGTGVSEVTVGTTYVPPIGWVLGRVDTVTTTAGGLVLGMMKNTWDGNKLKAKREYLDTAGGWVVTQLDYDLHGNLVSVIQPDTVVDDYDRVIAQGEGIKRETWTEYDANFHAYPAKVWGAKGVLNQYTEREYTNDGLVTKAWDVNRQLTTTLYDEFGRIQSVSRPDGGKSTYEYLEFGNPSAQRMRVRSTIDTGTRETFQEEYFDGLNFKWRTRQTADCATYAVVELIKDTAGRPWKTSLPFCGDVTATPVYAVTTYDAAGRVKTVTAPDQKVTTYTYGTNWEAVTDAASRTTKKYFNARKQLTSVVDGLNQTTTYTPDALGRLRSVTMPGETSAAVSFEYDTLNRKRRTSQRHAGATTIAYYPSGNVKSTTVESVDALGTPVTKVETLTYDALNRVETKTRAGVTPTIYGYDDPTVTNGIGRLTAVYIEGSATKLSYWPNGQPAVTVKEIGGKTYSQRYWYDYLGRVTKVQYPDNSQADYAYTTGGNLNTLKHDNVTIATWSQYDASGRPGRVDYQSSVASQYSYDTMGHLATLKTSKGTLDYQNLTYNWYGGVTGVPATGGLNIAKITDGRASKVVGGINTDETQTYTYDALNRLTQAIGVWGTKTFGYGGTNGGQYGNLTTFGGLVNRTLAYVGEQAVSGTGFSASYDPWGNMTDRALDGTSWRYGWNADNRLVSVTRNGALTAEMTYDDGGERLLKVYTAPNGLKVTTLYVGDLYEKRSFSDGRPERHTVHLYANGQLVSSLTREGAIATAYLDANEWRGEAAAAAMYSPSTLSGAGQKVLHAAAAVVKHPLARRWGGFGVLVALAAAALVLLLTSLRRDGIRRLPARLQVTAAAMLVVLVFSACSDGARVGSTSARAVSGDTTAGPATGRVYYHRNHVNSSAVITDASGNAINYTSYLPFGEISAANSWGVDAVTKKFTGQEFDEETGLYNYGARYYDPAIGRFVSADSVIPDAIGAQGFNKYSYVVNNPVLYVDPTGHSFDFIGDFFKAVGRAVSAVFHAIGQAIDWFTTAVMRVGWIGRAVGYAVSMFKAMASNPMAVASFVFSAALTISGLAPEALALWFKATAASISGSAMAMAAGLRDPTALAIIGALNGAAGAGARTFMEFFKTAVSWAIDKSLAAIEGAKLSRWLAPLNALAASQIVNTVMGKTGWVFTKDGAVDPDAKGGRVEGVTSTYSQTSGRFATVDTGSGYTLIDAQGYAGIGEGLNNWRMDWETNVGPLPSVWYRVGSAINGDLGKPQFFLDPGPFVSAQRSNFWIHADNSAANFTASHGCIILPLSARLALKRFSTAQGTGDLWVTR